MSFILDALRKSETERQKDVGPPLSRIPVASPRHVVPIWAWVALVGLGAAVLALGGAWWQTMRNTELGAGAPLEAASGSGARDTDASEALSAGATIVDATSAETTSVEAPGREIRNPSLVGAPAAGATGAALPTLAELRATGVTLPSLTLELHVFHANPASRFVYINGGRYAEGQRLNAGPSVVEILPEGAVLSQDGRDFLLLPQ